MKIVLFVRNSVCDIKREMIERSGYVIEPFDEKDSIVSYPWPADSGFSSFPWLFSGGEFLHQNLAILFSLEQGCEYYTKSGKKNEFQKIPGKVEKNLTPLGAPEFFEHRLGTGLIVRYSLVKLEIAFEKPEENFLSVPGSVFYIRKDKSPIPI